MGPHGSTKSTVARANLREAAPLRLVTILFVAVSIFVFPVERAFAANDIIPSVQYQSLAELFARKSYGNTKPTSLLYSDGAFEPELCIFRDTEYGTEVWRLANDPDATQHHCHINRSPWNANGSMMCFQTYRYIPGYYYSGGDFRMLLMTSDVDSVRVVSPEEHSEIVPYASRVNWDRVSPNIMWFAYFDGLYRTDVANHDATVLFQALPNTDRRKSIFSYLGEGNQIMVNESNSSSYVLNLYFVDQNKPAGSRLVYYPINFGITGVGCHSTSEEYHIHDIYFRRNADTTYIMNFGPSGSVGEACFFEIPYSGDKSKIKLCYPDEAHGIPYYSHPAWNHDGTRVAYVGESSPGSNVWGIHVRNHDSKTVLATLTRQVTSAHLAWDGYDDEWVFGSSSNWPGGVTKIFKMNTVEPSCIPFVNPYTGINGTSTTYCTLPRPAQSPDGTKVLYTSSMLQHSDSKPEVYVAVARYPYPPTNITASGTSSSVTISWQPHGISREVKGYHVYRSENTDTQFVELTESAVSTTSYTDNAVQPGKTYYYAVTSEEFSSLESDILSDIVRVTVTQGGAESSFHRAQGLRDWDNTPPGRVTGLSMQQVASGQYRLTWTAPSDRDVRYYNIHYSVESAPSATQDRLIASMPRNTTTYLDWLARTDASPYYTVTAVDRAGNQSAPTSVPAGETDNTPPSTIRDLDAQ